MSTFTWIPDQGATESTEAKITKAQFGDGYSQRVANGINNLAVTWDLSFSTRTKTEITAICDFLKLHKDGDHFQWAPPGETLANYICTKWKRTLKTDTDGAVSATFERVYD